jgi:hypothetical protein
LQALHLTALLLLVTACCQWPGSAAAAAAAAEAFLAVASAHHTWHMSQNSEMAGRDSVCDSLCARVHSPALDGIVCVALRLGVHTEQSLELIPA